MFRSPWSHLTNEGKEGSCVPVVQTKEGEPQSFLWGSTKDVFIAQGSQGAARETETHGERSMARNVEEKAKDQRLRKKRCEGKKTLCLRQ